MHAIPDSRRYCSSIHISRIPRPVLAPSLGLLHASGLGKFSSRIFGSFDVPTTSWASLFLADWASEDAWRHDCRVIRRRCKLFSDCHAYEAAVSHTDELETAAFRYVIRLYAGITSIPISDVDVGRVRAVISTTSFVGNHNTYARRITMDLYCTRTACISGEGNFCIVSRPTSHNMVCIPAISQYHDLPITHGRLLRGTRADR